MSWERIETKVKPIARSGHRMAIWKHFIVLFGGFVDVANYLNDVWLFSFDNYKWEQVEFPPHHQQPSPRSGFSFLPTPDGVVLHGGYYKDYIKGKRPIGIALDDTWFLKMSLERKEIKWEKRKKIGYAPSPSRSGCTMALWPAKGQGVMFGGVSDVDKDEEVLENDEDDGEDEDGQEEEEEDNEGNTDEDFKTSAADVAIVEETPALSKEELLALRARAQDFLGSTKDANRSLEDQLSTPLPGESLATFYARSKDYWAQKAHETSDNRGKLLRRDGFGLAEDRYATYKPILDEVEKILAEAGLDEEEMKRVGGSENAPGSSANRNRR
ncbi:hypothetical protein FRB98_007809 [Tulasnella sp. 332]|nr:hypothetical protein FRB98_007809 [Tulasnella sp. 332]